MTSVLYDTELCHLLPRPNTRVIGGDHSVHCIVFFLMLSKGEDGICLQTENV